MEYQNPNMEVLELQIKDVVTLSVDVGGSGDDVNDESWQ